MREIKFRGKHIGDNEWVYGYLLFSQSGICSIRSIDDFLTYQVDPETVGQFTGLHDKNGKEIYEGDILRFPPKEKIEVNNYVSYEVFWHDNDYADRHIGWQMNRHHYHGNICGTINYFTTCLPKYTQKMIIIGNIYDNPELLKGGLL